MKTIKTVQLKKKPSNVIHIDSSEFTKRNEMHFQAQLKNRGHVFINRKKRAKGGYRKHKNAEE